jgi:hypothetical protein
MGIRLLIAFFLFGTCMTGLTAFTLTWPGTPLDLIWRMNPQGHAGLSALGWPAAAGMAAFCVLMGSTALGLTGRRRWAWRSAAAILALNAASDLVVAALHRDPQTLIGPPIAGLIIWWMSRPPIREQFR